MYSLLQLRICPAQESGGVGFGFGEGAGVADGVEGFVGVVTGLGLGVGAGATVKTTGTCAGASVFVGSVKLIVPTYVPARKLVMLTNHDPDELRVMLCLPALIIVEAGTYATVPVTTGVKFGRTTLT